MNVEELLAANDIIIEHHGVKGQKWGVKRVTGAVKGHYTKQNQKRVTKQQKSFDRLRRLEAHKGTKADAFLATMLQVPIGNIVLGGGISGGASRSLNQHRKNQMKIQAGKKKVHGLLQRSVGFDAKKLDFSKLK